MKSLHMAPILLGLTAAAWAAQTHQGSEGFPELINADIPGAPTLQRPFMVMGATQPVLTEKHGLAAPALWDWNRDGKRDLLVGEFETCTVSGGFPGGESYGSALRVYLNVGTDAEPRFTDDFQYARDTEGTVMEVEQWCCIGFTPQFVDLNADGHPDMITGQYHPGEVTWFRGSPQGFLPGIKVPQAGNPAASGNVMLGYKGKDGDAGSFTYWAYSSASFGDLDDDGDHDLVLGGIGGLRISENIGTPRQPKFAERKLLLDVNGHPLRTREISAEEKARLAQMGEDNPAGDSKTSPLVVDWDNDGVPDLLVTNSYIYPGQSAVDFFRGVKTAQGHRFEPGKPLFTGKDGAKTIPGSGPRVYVDDWNKDGVKDLLIGASVVTVHGRFHDQYSWSWERDTGIEAAGKDAGKPPTPNLHPGTWEAFKAESTEMMKVRGRTIDETELRQQYDSLLSWYEEALRAANDPVTPAEKAYRHQGRVYVMLGHKPGAAHTRAAGTSPEARAVLEQAGAALKDIRVSEIEKTKLLSMAAHASRAVRPFGGCDDGLRRRME